MTQNGIALILGVTFGDRRSPFILDLLNSVAKRDRLGIDVFVLDRNPKWIEIQTRSSCLSHFNPNPKVNLKEEMERIYNQVEAGYLYVYLVKLRRGNGKVALMNLVTGNGDKGRAKITENTSLGELFFQFKDFFKRGQYRKAIDMHKDVEKFSQACGLKYGGEIAFILGSCYERLGQHRKAISELKKAAKMNSETGPITIALSRCYRNIGEIERAGTEIEKTMLKLKKSPKYRVELATPKGDRDGKRAGTYQKR